ncbi:MAG: site-2 protease family protein [Nitrospirota bacterium]
MEELSTIQKIVVIAPPFVLAVILHEVTHGWIAEKLGDPTARNAGRLTLNPIRHIDLYWTIIMPLLLYFTIGFVVGGAKPVPINPYNFKNPKRDMALSSLAGPGVNLLLGVAFAFLLRSILPILKEIVPDAVWEPAALPVALMLGTGVVINVALAVFNMIPIPPLDGSRIVYWLLPDKQAAAYYRLEPYGILILMALLALRILGTIVWPIIVSILYFLLGEDLLVFLANYLLKR